MFFSWMSLLVTILCIGTISASYKYDISACMIFRDEAPYLKEWIEFHRLVGIEHFYLYNNLSQDNYKEVLRPYIKAGVVELIEWNRESCNVSDWDVIQIAAYNHGFNRAKNETKWLAIIDSDEFLFPTHENNLSEFLKHYEKRKRFGGLLVNWVTFGTSWVNRIPENKLLIETLLLCDPNGSNHFKSLFLTKRVSHVCSPHYVVYKKKYRHFTPNGGFPPFIQIDKIRINHYWSRDEWYLNHFKIPRRLQWGTDPETCKLWAEASNGEPGTEILRFVEPLRLRMKPRFYLKSINHELR